MNDAVVTMLDTYDTMILIYLDENEPATTTTIARAIFEPKDRRELIKCDNRIRAKLKQLVELGLVDKKDNGNSIYSLNKERVFFGSGKLYLPMTKKRGKIYLDIGDFIAVKTVDGDFHLRRLNEVNTSIVKK
jgi:hypothetical protein